MENNTEITATRKSFAAIDIGSNAVRLLIKQVVEPGPHPKLNKALLVRVPLRLGFDVFSEGKISEKKEKNLIRLMKSYRHLMKIYGTDIYRACATSAMRDAANGPQLIKRVEKASGIRIEIIDGQEEARIVYENHIENMKGRKGNYMYVDVGGGSTEINLISDGGLVCSRSYNIGTVRILNNAATEDEWKRLRKDMKDLSLKPLSVEERIETFDLKPDRADVIVPAAEIFITIADILGSSTIYVPVIGLADGIIDDLYSRSAADN